MVGVKCLIGCTSRSRTRVCHGPPRAAHCRHLPIAPFGSPLPDISCACTGIPPLIACMLTPFCPLIMAPRSVCTAPGSSSATRAVPLHKGQAVKAGGGWQSPETLAVVAVGAMRIAVARLEPEGLQLSPL